MLTANFYFWLFSGLLITLLLMIILISYLLKIKTFFPSGIAPILVCATAKKAENP